MMKVSVIIPTYNRKEYLIEVLKRLQNQDYDKSKIQVIVVDNESTDGTEDALTSITHDYKLEIVKVARENKFEAAKLRNRGAKMVNGDIIVFVDSDILLPKDFISNHVKYYKSADDRVSVIGSVYYLQNKDYGEEIEQILHNEKLTIDPLEKEYSKYNECGSTNPLVWMMYHSGNISMTKKVFEEVGGFDEWHTEWSIEDLDFGYQIYKKGIHIFYSKYAYGLHKWHKNDDKNMQSVGNGFQYLINKENNNELIRQVFDHINKNQYYQTNHICVTETMSLLEYTDYKKNQNSSYKYPIVTIAIYSTNHNENLFQILERLEQQYNGEFEVLLVDDSDHIEKNIEIQRSNYKFDLRLVNVNWHEEKKNHIIDKLSYKKVSNKLDLTGIEKVYLNIANHYSELYEESIKNKFEQFVYDKAIGTYVKFIDDRKSCGSSFISDIWRDLIN